MKALARVLVGLVCGLGSMVCIADWTLLDQQSSLNFVSVKKGTIGEVHQFKNISGGVLDNGSFELLIDLNSVDTGIEIRDERMKQYLFVVPQFPSAKVSGNVDAKLLKGLKVGEINLVKTELLVDLHGLTVKTPVEMNIVKLSRNKVMAMTAKPLVLKAADFGLSAGVAKLQELAGLPSIAEAIPVTFTAVFQKK
jgi:hypothetical protein